MASTSKKQVVLIGVDDSSESFYSLEWALEHLFSRQPDQFKVILVHVKMTPTSVLRLSGPGVGDFITVVEKDIMRTAQSVIERAKEICKKKSVTDCDVEIGEGDARSVLCEAVVKHHADMIIVGSHGYGAFKRVILGSVSDYCAHHAHCSVLIVKKPREQTPEHKGPIIHTS